VCIDLVVRAVPDFSPLQHNEVLDEVGELDSERKPHFGCVVLLVQLVHVEDVVEFKLAHEVLQAFEPGLLGKREFECIEDVGDLAVPDGRTLIHVRLVGADRERFHVFLDFQLNLDFVLVEHLEAGLVVFALSEYSDETADAQTLGALELTVEQQVLQFRFSHLLQSKLFELGVLTEFGQGVLLDRIVRDLVVVELVDLLEQPFERDVGRRLEVRVVDGEFELLDEFVDFVVALGPADALADCEFGDVRAVLDHLHLEFLADFVFEFVVFLHG